MIDNNIIQSLGAGSGIDSRNLVTQLTAVERLAPQERIDKQKELAETKISDFGKLTSALSTLKEAAAVLTDPEALFSKSASFTQSDALVPVKLDTDVQAGTYGLNVSQVASAHTMAFAGFSSVNDAVGEGTLTLNFGSWTRFDSGVNEGEIDTGTAFAADTSKEPISIVIDDSSNTLTGLRDKINASNSGVTASIVNDGTSYRLSIVSASGASNELQIDVAETGGGDATDDIGLSRFAFNASKTGFESFDSQGGKNAKLTLNGIDIERDSNKIDDVVQGLTLDVLKVMDANDLVTISITDDKTFAETNIRTFVDSYNAFIDTVQPLFGVSDIEDDKGNTNSVRGSLSNDSLGKSTLSQIRDVIASAIPGLSGANYSSLTNIGIRTDLDGKIEIDETDFKSALETRFTDIQKILAPSLSTTNDNIYVNSTTDKTAVGEYDIEITQAPTKGNLTGTAATIPLTIGPGESYTFYIEVDGVAATEITVPEGSYATGEELAVVLQAKINSDENIKDKERSVTVEFTGGAFSITSDNYGASSTVNITGAGTDFATQLGLGAQTGTAGLSVAGTVNGVAGFGSGNVLLPALSQPGTGLAMIVAEGTTSETASISFSRGFAGELESLITTFLSSEGAIATRKETLEDGIESLGEDQKSLDRRMEAYEERLLNQFIAMERILSSLKSSGSFLDNLSNILPFTAPRD